jgi:hypothetical protein
MTTSKSLTSRLLVILSFTFLLASCGSQKPMVSNISVSSNYVGSDVYLAVGANLAIGNVTLPQTTLPIYMPKTWQEIGTVSMTSAMGGGNFVKIDVNVSALSKLTAQSATLPNGSLLPLIANNQVIKVPVGNGAELYLTIAGGSVALGVAIPFKTFDAMGAKVGTSSLFPVFNIRGILGAAGVYTSKVAGKNGFGLFVDVTSAIDPLDFINIGDDGLNYSSVKPSSSKESSINDSLYNLHQKRTQLSLK